MPNRSPASWIDATKRVLAACIAVAATILAGCSEQVSGHAVSAHPPPPPPPPEAPYAAMLNNLDRATATYNAEIRMIDPCGYVDVESVNRVGVIKEFSAKKSQTDCELEVVVGSDGKRSLEIKVSIVPKGTTYKLDSHPVTIAGTRVTESTDHWPGRPAKPGFDTCHDLLPFSDQSVLHVAVMRRTDDAACAETHTIVAGMIPRLADRPQRKDSKRDAFHAISVRDPCDLLVRVGAGHVVNLSPTITPWKCEYLLDHRRGSYRTAQYDWRPISSFIPSRDTERAEVAGHPALVTKGPQWCNIAVAVPEPQGGNAFAPIYDQALATNIVSVGTMTCDDTEAAANAAVEAFLSPG